MDTSYKLNGSTHEKVYKRLEKKMLAETERSAAPSIVILGGQPGAGKSRLIDLAQKEIFKGKTPAVINGDDYREAHPQSREIIEKDDRKYAERTDPDVRVWTKRLFDAAIENKRDIVFEGTMRNKGPIMETIQKLRDEGYRIHIMTMAVRAESSRLGTLQRYEDQKAHNGYGRWVDPASHEEAYNNMPDTVRAIEQDSPIDSMRVYNRAGDVLYSNERDNKGIFHRPVHTRDASCAITQERTKPLSHEERQKINNERQNIEKVMLNLGISQKEISDTKAYITTGRIRRNDRSVSR